MTMMNWEVWWPLLRYKQKQYIYVYLCELPHPIPNVLLNLLKSGFSYHFMKLLFLKSTWHFPSLLPQTTDTFQVFFWFLRSIKLCWPFQSFLKSCPLSSKTCSLFSLNSPALPPWPALWATFPLCVPGTVMFPDSYPGSSLLLPVYVHFFGYLIHFYDLNYHLMLMASKSIYLTPFYHIWLPSEHSPGGATGSSYSTWPRLNLSPFLSQSCYWDICPLISQWPKPKPGVMLYLSPFLSVSLQLSRLNVSQISILSPLLPHFWPPSRLVVSCWLINTHICFFAYYPNPSSTL